MAKQRKHGSGTVRLRSDGRWEGRVVIGYDDSGLPKTKNVLAKTKAECEKKLKSLIAAQKGSEPQPPRQTMTVAQWLDFWYQTYKKTNLRPNTQMSYERRIYQHIIPNLGPIPLNKLTTGDIQQFYTGLKQNGRLLRQEQYGEGLSGQTVRSIHTTFHAALDKAVSEKIIPKNPSDFCRLPSAKAREMQVLSPEEIQRLLIQAKEDGCFELLLLELSTGLRRGEICALQWNDLNFNTGELQVKRQVSYRGHTNEFYLFGGRDEGSAALIQGITFAGVLLDEVALMPRSFVEQACARCSVTGSRLWFNCNPEGPYHWFYTEWIGHAAERNCLYLHFTMEDNPALSPDIRSRYARLYSGVFYRRFVLGQWVAAEGRVYDFFDAAKAPPPPEGPFNQWYISCDYGTVNPASFGLWGRKDAVWYRVKEFYFDSRREQRQMTDAEYERALRELAGGRPIAAVIVDPSAASFLETLRRNGWNVRRADNDVLSGIRRTSDLLKCGRLVLCDTCTDCLREIEQYVWDPKAGRDAVRKEHDHAMDDMRYFVSTVLAPQRPALAACTAIRRA